MVAYGSSWTHDHAERYSTRVNWESDRYPSTLIAEVVAAATNEEVSELEPLQNYVHTDAIDSLLRCSKTEFDVSFRYDGVHVTAHDDGLVVVDFSD